MVTGSIISHKSSLQSEQFADEFSPNAGAEQDHDDHRIQQVLNLGHALVAIPQ